MHQRVVETDGTGRVSLGKRYANSRFLVEEEDGEVTLRRAVVLPESELWLYRNPEAWGKVQQGLSEAREGKLEPVDLDGIDN